jgi:ribosomal protein S18 acetylase RimI-like enzyme
VPEIRRFEPMDLDGVLRLCEIEGWTSFPDDRERALRVLTVPGVSTVVALDDGEVVGFAELLSDGELQSYLANLVVGQRFRRSGLGRLLVQEVLKLGGGQRIDLLSEDDAVTFYESIPPRGSRVSGSIHTLLLDACTRSFFMWAE